MAAVGHTVGRNASVRLICGAGTIDLSARTNSVDIEYNADGIEVSAFGDTSHTFIQGLTVFTFAVNGWWSGSHASEVLNSEAACLAALVGNSAACECILWVAPAGSAAGSISYSACVNVQSAPVNVPADGVVGMNSSYSARAGSITLSSAAWS